MVNTINNTNKSLKQNIKSQKNHLLGTV